MVVVDITTQLASPLNLPVNDSEKGITLWSGEKVPPFGQCPHCMSVNTGGNYDAEMAEVTSRDFSSVCLDCGKLFNAVYSGNDSEEETHG